MGTFCSFRLGDRDEHPKLPGSIVQRDRLSLNSAIPMVTSGPSM